MDLLPSSLLDAVHVLREIRAGDPPELSNDDIRHALATPIADGKTTRNPLDEIHPGETVCFVVSDHTRHTGVNRVLPLVLGRLRDAGCTPRDMSVLVASGIHRPPRPEEIRHILGADVAAAMRDRVFLHDADDTENLVAVGVTKRGHTVRVNRRALDCRHLVLTGAATYHYHAGFGGGRKALVPGLAARKTIAHNHSLTLDPEADRIHPCVRPGVLDGNPVAEEMLECARMCGPDMILNTVVNPGGRPVGLFCGDLDAAHRAACRMVESVYRADLGQGADLVIASAAGAGNWIQSHKALYNASRAVRDGGRIVLHAPCPEGLGDERFRYWMRRPSLESVFAELRQMPEVLGQTALSSRTRGRATVLVTDMPEADRLDLGIRCAPSIEDAARLAVEELRAEGVDRPTCVLMPQARYTVPFRA